MCSFLVTNKTGFNIEALNFNLKRRGPDETIVLEENNILCIHNLLHITGEKTVQPLRGNNSMFLYNGEIYNYIGNNDTRYAFKLLEEEGINAIKKFDGEFALVYIKDDDIFISSDVFGTKPIFYSKEDNKFGISSYYSVLGDLGFQSIQKLPANTILNLTNLTKTSIHEFNLDQNISDFNLWERSFLESVDKRITKNSFLSLSSGYDSGAIALASKILNKPLKLYCIPNNENKYIIEERKKILGNIEYINVNEKEYSKHYNYINTFADTFLFSDYNFKQDRASIGLSFIFEAAKKVGLNVSISGTGADEILSDYGINGRGVFAQDDSSTLKGIFPQDLSIVFPWKNFYRGKQERYLYKEESIAGCYGIETRYPFLDRDCVQYFLNLSSQLKNKQYKAPLDYFFKKYNFPFEESVKRGFSL